MRTVWVVGAACILVGVGLSACGSDSGASFSGSSGGEAGSGGQASSGGSTSGGASSGGSSASTGGSGSGTGGAASGAGGGTGAEPGAGAAGEAEGGEGGSGGASGGSAGSGGAPDDECVAAIRVDQCCAQAQPVPRSELEADGCLVLFPSGLRATELPDCPGYDPEACAAVDCDGPSAPSRLVRADGGGACQFVDECETVEDCVQGLDFGTCCDCPAPMPRALVEDDECLAAVGSSDRPTCADCSNVLCEQCPELDTTLACTVPVDGLSRCVWATQAPSSSGCSAESTCRDDLACYTPGEIYCAGPAPPPDECETDNDCDGDALFICEPVGHCGATECVPGCLRDDECPESEVCSDRHRCEPPSCAANGTCASPNFACQSGACVRKPCSSSSECGDYCVNGYCFETRGQCLDPLAP